MNEKMIFEIVAASRGKSQKGDVSKALLEQGFFDNSVLPRGLKERHDSPTGNPIDIKDKFNEQNPF